MRLTAVARRASVALAARTRVRPAPDVSAILRETPFRLPETPERFLQPRLFAPRAASRVPSPDPSPHRIHPPAPE